MKAPIPDSTSISIDLIDRYLVGTATPAETEQLRHWVASLPNGEARLDKLRLANEVTDHKTWQIDQRWTDLLQRIQPKSEVASIHPTNASDKSDTLSSSLYNDRSVHTSSRFSRLYRYGFVAGIAALIAIAVGLNGTFEFKSESASSNAVSTYATPSGQRASITLPDGSSVMLNAGSRLEVPMDFNHKERRLVLNGEALFSVEHHNGEPFTVIAGKHEARVLGTRFVVRHFDTDTTVVVAVQEGKVAVSSSVVTANQEILIDRTGNEVIKPTSASRFSFERGILSFDGTSLKDAIPDLNRWFDADIRLGDSQLAERRIEGDYGAGTVGTLAEILELTFDVRVVKAGRILTLYPRG